MTRTTGDEFYVSADGTVKLQTLVTNLSGKPIEGWPSKLLTPAEVEALRRVLD